MQIESTFALWFLKNANYISMLFLYFKNVILVSILLKPCSLHYGEQDPVSVNGSRGSLIATLGRSFASCIDDQEIQHDKGAQPQRTDS
jgi:hypothetical protein